MVSPYLRYLNEVLGVSSVVLPKDLSIQLPNSAAYLGVTNEPITEASKTLAKKMFASLGIQDFLLKQIDSNSLNVADDFGHYKMVWFFGALKPATLMDARVLELPSLSQLNNSQDAKREAWQKIKVLKK